MRTEQLERERKLNACFVVRAVRALERGLREHPELLSQ
jgi:hypothetical protein